MRPSLLLLALTTSCNWLLDPGESGDRVAMNRELDRRIAQWGSLAISNYDFEYRLVCFCSPTATQQVTIEVRNAEIVRVLDTNGGEVAPESGVRWPTVDSLFVWARDLANNRTYTVELAFNEDFGFPSFLSADVARAVDDEFSHNAGNLVVRTVP